jgi:hypothetical protein
VENKILTCENLQTRGLEGPNCCHLCFQDNENINHLFIHCSFTKSVWERFAMIHSFKNCWNGNTLNDCFKNSVEEKFVPTLIVAHICWFIWLERNSTIFEEINPSIHSVIYKTLGFHKRQLTTQNSSPLRAIMISTQRVITTAWFDGASQLDGLKCGVGGVFKTPDLTVYRWVFNCGSGTNTRAELLGV